MNEVNLGYENEQILISGFSDAEIAFLELIAKVIVRISFEESYKKK